MPKETPPTDWREIYSRRKEAEQRVRKLKQRSNAEKRQRKASATRKLTPEHIRAAYEERQAVKARFEEEIEEAANATVKGVTKDHLRVLDHLFRVGLHFHINSLNDFTNEVPGEYERSWANKIKPGRVSERFVANKFLKEHEAEIEQIIRTADKYFANKPSYAISELSQVADESLSDAKHSRRYQLLIGKSDKAASKLMKRS